MDTVAVTIMVEATMEALDVIEEMLIL